MVSWMKVRQTSASVVITKEAMCLWKWLSGHEELNTAIVFESGMVGNISKSTLY